MTFDIRPGALLFYSLLWFFDSSGLWSAFLAAAAVHEAGHLLFLRAAGVRPRCLRLGIAGLELDYRGELRGRAGAAAIAAGPIFGLAYGMLAFSESDFFALSGGVSIALSLFNLLPLLPLDGGRLLELSTGERGRGISRVMSIIFAAVGLWLWLSRGWISVFAMGLWLLWWNYKNKA